MDKKTQQMNLEELPVLAPGALERLKEYSWPGNVRELENLVERSIIQNMTGSKQRPLEFSPFVTEPIVPESHINIDETQAPLPLDEVMVQHIKSILKMTNGKVQGPKGAAAILGIHPNTLRNRMNKLGIPYGRSAKSGKDFR